MHDDEARIPTRRITRLLRGIHTGMRGRRVLSGDPATDLRAWVDSIGQLKGIPMKVGQILGHVDLLRADPVKVTLASLQTHSSAMPFTRVQEVLDSERAGWRDRMTLEPKPIAAASIGQVHRARLDGRDDVVVKVQFPEVEAAI